MSNRNNKPQTPFDRVADDFLSRHNRRAYNVNTSQTKINTMRVIYEQKATELAMNRFKWSNMPEEIDIRFVEMTLLNTGLSVFYHDGRYDKFMALRGAAAAIPNYQDNPTAFNVVGSNFISRTISATREKTDANGTVFGKAIPIWANYNRLPDFAIIQLYAERLAELDRSIDINTTNSRQPKVAAYPAELDLTFANINRQINQGENFIAVNSKTIGDLKDYFQVLDLGVNVDHVEKLHIVRTRIWNEFMGLLGIENANQDKKERLVANEVDANNDQTEMMRYVNLNARRQAAEAINREYGLNISVDYYTAEPSAIVKDEPKPEEKNDEEVNNDDVHS